MLCVPRDQAQAMGAGASAAAGAAADDAAAPAASTATDALNALAGKSGVAAAELLKMDVAALEEVVTKAEIPEDVLKERAAGVGIAAESLEEAGKAENAKGAVLALILAAAQKEAEAPPAEAPPAPPAADESAAADAAAAAAEPAPADAAAAAPEPEPAVAAQPETSAEDEAKEANQRIIAKLSEDEISSYTAAFNKIDADGGGTVDAKELQSLMASLGQDKKEEDIKKMLDEVDADGSGEIDVEEFLVLMVNYVGPQGEAKDEEIEEAFKLMDADGGGTIDRDELGDCLTKLGEPMQVRFAAIVFILKHDGFHTKNDRFHTKYGGFLFFFAGG